MRVRVEFGSDRLGLALGKYGSAVRVVRMYVRRRGVRAEDCGEQGFEPPTHPCTCSNRTGVGEWENVVSILAVQKNDESLSLQTKRRSPDPGSWPRNQSFQGDTDRRTPAQTTESTQVQREPADALSLPPTRFAMGPFSQAKFSLHR